MKLEIGATLNRTHTITEEDLRRFYQTIQQPAEILQDAKDGTPDEAQLTAQSIFATSLVTSLLEMIPGKDKVYLSQSLKFRRSIKLGDQITTTLMVKYYRDGEMQVEARCINQDGIVILDSDTLLTLSVEDASATNVP